MKNVSVEFLERLLDFCDAVSDEDTSLSLHRTARTLGRELGDILEDQSD